jgi:hypothetical protein
MTMTESRLTPPQPLELVPAADAVALIDAARRELDELGTRAAEARAVADEVSARAEREGADERASTWAIVRLQRFIDTLREEVERDAQTVVDAARRGVRDRSAESRGEEPLLGTGPLPHVPTPTPIVERAVAPVAPPEVLAPAASTLVASPPVEAVVAAPTPAPEEAAPAAPAPAQAPVRASAPAVVLAPVPVPAPAPLAPESPADAPPIVSAVSWTAPSVAVTPAANGNAHTAFETPVTAPVVVAPVPVAPVAPAPVAPAPVIAARAAPVAAPAKKRGFLHGFPVSAALEVLAVILVLLFILLRLS